MRIAVVCPVGRLDRFGYQYTMVECLGSFRRISEEMYLPSTTRSLRDGALPGMISDERTWFDRLPDGSEWFCVHRIAEASNVGVHAAQASGADAVVELHINNFVTEAAAEWLRAECAAMVEAGEGWRWLYRRDQLANRMSGATVRLPRIINCWAGSRPRPKPMRLSADSLGEPPYQVGLERGDWPEQDGTAVVDVQLEMPLQDLADKLNYMRCYSDLLAKRKPVFEWEFWRTYYAAKMRKKRWTEDAAVVESRPEFVSWEVLEDVKRET